MQAAFTRLTQAEMEYGAAREIFFGNNSLRSGQRFSQRFLSLMIRVVAADAPDFTSKRIKGIDDDACGRGKRRVATIV